MCNVIKMDWFRFRKSKFVYIILIALSLLFLFMTVLDSSLENEAPDTRAGEDKNSFELYTEDYDTDYTADFTEKCEMLASAFSGNIVTMTVLIFAGLFAGAYHKNKFEKNIVGLTGGKRLIVSNFIICSIYCFMIMCTAVLVSLVGYRLFYLNFVSMPTGDVAQLFRFLILYYLLLDSAAIVMSCFVQIVGNQTLAIIIALVYGSGIIYDIIDYGCQMAGIQGFSIQRYMLLGNLYNLSIHDQGSYPFTVFIALLFGIGFFAVHIAVKSRQDIST